MAIASQLENRPVAQLKRQRLSEWQALDAAHTMSWDLKFLSLGLVISFRSPPSPGNLLSDVLFVGYHLYSSHLCDREVWVTFVIPTRGRGKRGEGLTSSASV